MSVVGLIRGHGGRHCRRPPGGRPALPAAVPVPGGEPAVGGGAALPLLRAVLQVVLRGLPRGRREVVGRDLELVELGNWFHWSFLSKDCPPNEDPNNQSINVVEGR